MNNDANLAMAKNLAEKVAANGGRAYFVGGFVRDGILGKENKDIDIEVHGLEPETLAGILEELVGAEGYKRVGASFGVFIIMHYDLDIAMPRTESKTGDGHRDFDIFVDPYLDTEKAAMRRDFTVNALMQDVLTGEIIDHFGGRNDMAKGVLRHVNKESFAEDPLRVLRGAQFAARFGWELAPETLELCASMPLDTLSKERVMEELSKALLKADKPSGFFEILREIGQLKDWFPEVEALIDVPQDPGHHPEGDAWIHTMHALDQAALLRDETDNKVGFMLAVLCHDFGKATITEMGEDGRWHSYNHEALGAPIAEKFMDRLTGERKLKSYVYNMVYNHGRPNKMVAEGAREKKFMKLYDDSVCPEDLILVAKSDYMGQGDNGVVGSEKYLAYVEIEGRLREMLEAFKSLMEKPFVKGEDLVAAGIEPGEEFKELLKYAHKLRLAGVEKELALKQVLGMSVKK